MSPARMSDPTAPVADAPAQNVEGVTPPETTAAPSATQKPAKMGLEQAREILRQDTAQAASPAGRDPLESLSAERDPLEQVAENDPLEIGLAEPGETPDAQAQTPEETPPQDEPEPQQTDSEPSTEAEDKPQQGRKRLNIYRRNPDGSYVYNERERAILQLSEEQGIGFLQAQRILYGEAPEETEQAAPEAEARPQEAPLVDELDSQIASLKAEKKQAADNLDMSRLVEIDEQLEGLREAKARRTVEQQQRASEAQQQLQAHAQRALERFPEASQEGSDLHLAITAEVARMERENPGAFADPRWPMTVAAYCAAELGIAPSSAKPAAAPSSRTAAPKPKLPARPAPAPAPGTATSASTLPTITQISQKIAEARRRGDMNALKAANAERVRLFGE